MLLALLPVKLAPIALGYIAKRMYDRRHAGGAAQSGGTMGHGSIVGSEATTMAGTLNSAGTGAVPATRTRSPATRAREKPNTGSYGECPLMR